MARGGIQGYTHGLVDMASGQISREIFVNEAIYQQELEQVFTRAWLFVGHESQIPKPGDYFVSCMGRSRSFCAETARSTSTCFSTPAGTGA